MKRIPTLLLFFTICLASVAPAQQQLSHPSATYYVKLPNGTVDTANIQAALEACVVRRPGCTLQRAGGKYLTRQLVAHNFRGTFKEGQSITGMLMSGEGKSRHVISGVPFVRWGEAARLNYPQKDILEPSYPAAFAMILEYWGEDLKVVETPEMAPKGWHAERKKGTLKDLKRLVDENIPVLVSPALTPFAHRLYSMISFWATIKHIDLGKQGPSSGLLGPMISVEAVNKSKEIREMANDSVVVAARVVVGYDDAKRVIILHDPSFGPVWEVDYEDFERMWGFDGNKYYTTLKPPDYAARLSRKPSTGAYAPRSPDNDASVHYVYGYTLESIGKLQEAEKEFRAALSLPGVSPSYQHLLHFELAILCAVTGRTEEAMSETQKSIDLFPGHAAPWKFLAAGLEKTQSGQDLGKRLEEANQKAKELCSEAAEAAVAQTLTQDFAIVGCKGKLPWAIKSQPNP